MDGDGDLDLVFTQIGGPTLLLRNDQDTGNRWLHVNLQQPGGNPRGIGARIRLSVDGKTMKRQINPTCSYLSQIPPTAYFGLGSSATIEELHITWPDGHEQTLAGVNADQVLTVERN
jgi:hypothetical protein